MGKIINLNQKLEIEPLLDEMNKYHLDFKILDNTFDYQSSKLIMINSKNVSRFLILLRRYMDSYKAKLEYDTLEEADNKIVQLSIQNNVSNIKLEIANIIDCECVKNISLN